VLANYVLAVPTKLYDHSGLFKCLLLFSISNRLMLITGAAIVTTQPL